MANLLLIDDDPRVREAVRATLAGADTELREAATLAAAREQLEARLPDLVLLDVMLPDGDGLDLLAELRRREPDACVVMISGGSDIATALRAVKLGAWDFLEKPLGRSKLQVTVRNALAQRARSHEQRVLRAEQLARWTLHGAAMAVVSETLERAARVNLPVLVRGESGTGKEIAARRLHALSDRWARPLVKLNCAAVPSGLLESELFGHTKGAFTGATAEKRGIVEVAEKGTLFLDEIGDMDPALQAKLLRVLQDGDYTRVGETEPRRADVRVIAATHQDLEERIADGRFREDLFYRLAGLELHLPALRDRREDLPALVELFVAEACAELKRTPPEVAPEALAQLRSHAFPGNVRELRHVIQRTLVLDDGARIERFAVSAAARRDEDLVGDLATVKRELLRRHLERRLAALGGSRPALAKELGMHVNNLYRLLRTVGM